MKKFIDLTGEKFGRLTVIQYAGRDKTGKMRMWECRCNCGKVVKVKDCNLKQGFTKSCGCLADEIRKRGKHYASDTRLYSIWTGMKTRCYNPNCKSYKDYGSRGIILCSEWKDNFEAFYKWSLSNRYSDELTIDRINPNGNYEPSNCRWVEKSYQNRNKKCSHFITINDQTKLLVDWCREYKISPSTVINRLKAGWNEIDAITKPVKTKRQSKWVQEQTDN